MLAKDSEEGSTSQADTNNGPLWTNNVRGHVVSIALNAPTLFELDLEYDND